MTIVRSPSEFPNASYSDAVVVSGRGSWIHLSGQVGLAPGATRCEGDVATQTQLCLDRMAASLGRHGAVLSSIVRLTVYLLDLKDYSAFTLVRAERFAGALPASTSVQVSGLLLNASIEIDALAFVPETTRHGPNSRNRRQQ